MQPQKSNWDQSKLAVNNWFSGSRYLQAIEVNKDMVKMRCNGQDIMVQKDILETQMLNASVYNKEVHMSKTMVSQMLESSNTACFTVQFRTQVNANTILQKLTQSSDQKDKRALAKELLSGKEHTLVGHSIKSDCMLGRSIVIDLATGGFK